MCRVNIYELKTHLSKYIELLEKGEEEDIIICRFDKPVAKISLYREKKKKICGCAKEKFGGVDFELKEGFEDIPELFGY